MKQLYNKFWEGSVFIIAKTALVDSLCDFPKIQERTRKNVIFTITWPSWVWKSVVIEPILEWSEKFINPTAFTTRNPRHWEINWREYYFITKKKFEKLKINWEIFEYGFNNGNFYWYTNKEMKRIFDSWKTPICNVDEEWVRQIWEKVDENYDVFKIFILPPAAKELKNRLVWRDWRWNGYLDKEGNKQKTNAIKRFSESKNWIKRAISWDIEYDAFLVNKSLSWSIDLIKKAFDDVICWKFDK